MRGLSGVYLVLEVLELIGKGLDLHLECLFGLLALLLSPLFALQQFGKISDVSIELSLLPLEKLLLLLDGATQQHDQLFLFCELATQGGDGGLKILFLHEGADVHSDYVVFQGSVFFLQLHETLLVLILQICQLRFFFLHCQLQLLYGSVVIGVLVGGPVSFLLL